MAINLPFKENILKSKESVTVVRNSRESVTDEPLSIDEIIDRTLLNCDGLPYTCDIYVDQIRELKSRLSRGRLNLAVLGQFNRGKSTFINALLGMKILPASVLPITSVPTIISYGQQISCRVRFLDKKPDLVVTQSLEKIQETLKMYVAEQNNPNNQLCVKEVEVYCSTPLLENGTALIDTPGFGSTHLHNTRVALTTLSECDAAIFLLSADPPLTQTELEFLKQVNRYVPRIFFVLNKTDLLSKDDLSTVDRFIKEVLIMQMKYPADLELFHICALRGEKAAGDIMHESWSASGMNVVKTKILDFMVREKYFTLSEALNEKFHEALNGIDFCLSEELKTFQAPVELLQREYDEILDHSIKLKRIMDKEIALVSIEEAAVLKFLEEQITSGTTALLEELAKEFDTMISKSPLKSDTIKTLSNVFTNIVLVKIEKFYSDIIYSCNKPVRKAIQIHTHEFNQFMENFKKILCEKNAESIRIQEKLDQCELSFEVWKIDGIIDCTITSEWNDRLRNRGTLVDRYKKQFESIVSVVVSEQLISIKSAIEEQIHISFKKMHEFLEKEYSVLKRLLDATLKKKDTAIQEKKSNGGTQCTLLQKSAEEFNAIRKMLS